MGKYIEKVEVCTQLNIGYHGTINNGADCINCGAICINHGAI